MGGGGSKQEQTSTVTTETNTNINDIGLTGAAAVDLADVLQTGAIESEAIRATSLNQIIQGVGSSYQQLVGGANELIQSGSEIVEQGSQQVTDAGVRVSNDAQAAQNTIRTLANRATGEDSDLVKAAPYIGMVLLAAVSLYSANK